MNKTVHLLDVLITTPYVMYPYNKVFMIRELTMLKTYSYSYFPILEYFDKGELVKNALEKFPLHDIIYLFQERLLKIKGSEWNIPLDTLSIAELEISTYCNWNCIYCPVKYTPLPSKVMTMELFLDIINKLVKAGINRVTFNSYNEPTIDKYFMERVRIISEKGIKLKLHTNGSGLNRKILDKLEPLNVIEKIVYNLPSIKENEFIRMTGSHNLKYIIDVINYSIELGLDIELSVQGTKEEISRNLPIINEYYEKKLNHKVNAWMTTDRAGNLLNEYTHGVNIESEKLFGGCNSVLRWLCINVKGDLFMCCNDYFKYYNWGNIKDGEVEQWLNSRSGILMRKKVFGAMKADKNFLCRKCNYMSIAQNISKLHKRRLI